jgi:hypothetical protein
MEDRSEGVRVAVALGAMAGAGLLRRTRAAFFGGRRGAADFLRAGLDLLFFLLVTRNE